MNAAGGESHEVLVRSRVGLEHRCVNERRELAHDSSIGAQSACQCRTGSIDVRRAIGPGGVRRRVGSVAELSSHGWRESAGAGGTSSERSRDAIAAYGGERFRVGQARLGEDDLSG